MQPQSIRAHGGLAAMRKISGRERKPAPPGSTTGHCATSPRRAILRRHAWKTLANPDTSRVIQMRKRPPGRAPPSALKGQTGLAAMPHAKDTSLITTKVDNADKALFRCSCVNACFRPSKILESSQTASYTKTEINEAYVIMIETFLLIGGLVIFAALALYLLKDRPARRSAVEPDKLVAELRHLGDGRKNVPNQSDASISQSLEPPVPDQIYLIDANLADIESGEAFKEFALEEYRSGHYPMPESAQLDRIMAKIDEIAKKKSDYVQTPPFAIVRSARLAANTNNGKTSWFGGNPMLGKVAWPRTLKGVPMHHWVSINLADLRGHETPPGLPELGRLAFFVNVMNHPYEARVLYIPDGETQTAPPDDLPEIHLKLQPTFRPKVDTKEVSLVEDPIWSVELVPLPMDGSRAGHAAACEILADRSNMLADSDTWHQMFGEGVSRQTAREKHPFDHMLLQIVSDDEMLLDALPVGAAVQFWISPDDLLHQNWDAVTVTFESD